MGPLHRKGGSMKKFLAVLFTIIFLGASSLALADRDRRDHGRQYRDGKRDFQTYHYKKHRKNPHHKRGHHKDRWHHRHYTVREWERERHHYESRRGSYYRERQGHLGFSFCDDDGNCFDFSISK